MTKERKNDPDIKASPPPAEDDDPMSAGDEDDTVVVVPQHTTPIIGKTRGLPLIKTEGLDADPRSSFTSVKPRSTKFTYFNNNKNDDLTSGYVECSDEIKSRMFLF